MRFITLHPFPRPSERSVVPSRVGDCELCDSATRGPASSSLPHKTRVRTKNDPESIDPAFHGTAPENAATPPVCSMESIATFASGQNTNCAGSRIPLPPAPISRTIFFRDVSLKRWELPGTLLAKSHPPDKRPLTTPELHVRSRSTTGLPRVVRFFARLRLVSRKVP